MMREALLLCVLLAAGCGGGAGDGAPALGQGAAELARLDAPALYAANCALCHGPQGDGDGSLKLDRPARSFRAGGFSFGNTEEAVFRTITSGIGGTPMPGFLNQLDEAQRRVLARHVIALGPEQVPGPGLTSILSVGARPVVVRAHLPALVEGAPEFPRGLLVGNPDGLSYEYRADDLRLLAVRQGPFADRKDWGERGGSPIEPLGRLIFLADADGDPAHEWEDQAGNPLRAVLHLTVDTPLAAVIQYELQRADGSRAATVSEACYAITGPSASGFARYFGVELADANEVLRHWPLRAQFEHSTGVRDWDLGMIGMSGVAVQAHGVGMYATDQNGLHLEVGRVATPGGQWDFSGKFDVAYLILPEPANESFSRLLQEDK